MKIGDEVTMKNGTGAVLKVRNIAKTKRSGDRLCLVRADGVKWHNVPVDMVTPVNATKKGG